MNKFFARLGMVNWKTTILGITSLISAAGVIANAYRTKDFGAIFTQMQTLGPIITLTLTGLGLLVAKDSTVTGAGSQSVVVTAEGEKVKSGGDVVGKQPAA